MNTYVVSQSKMRFVVESVIRSGDFPFWQVDRPAPPFRAGV